MYKKMIIAIALAASLGACRLPELDENAPPVVQPKSHHHDRFRQERNRAEHSRPSLEQEKAMPNRNVHRHSTNRHAPPVVVVPPSQLQDDERNVATHP